MTSPILYCTLHDMFDKTVGVEGEPVMERKHRTVKGAQRVSDLLAAAGELFLEKGFDGVAVDELIAKVGGSRSNIYNHFGGKEGLFKEAMIRQCAEVGSALDMLSLPPERTPTEILPLLGRQLLMSALAPRTLALHRLLVNEGCRFPEVARAMWDVSYGKAIALLSTWMRAQQAFGGLTTAIPPQLLAEQFVSLVAGNTKLEVASGLRVAPLPEKEIEEIVEHAVRTFLFGASANA